MLCYRHRSYKDSRKNITAARLSQEGFMQDLKHAQREHHFIMWAEADRVCKVRKTTHTHNGMSLRWVLKQS